MNEADRKKARNKRRRDAYAKANLDAKEKERSMALAREELAKNEKQRLYKSRSRTKKHKKEHHTM